MADEYNVLFLCNDNSARSIMAEAMLNNKGRGRFMAYSAGSRPGGAVRREALAQLEGAGISTAGLREKSWDEFAAEGAPEMDFIITLCDDTLQETCPVWPGHPATAHWTIPDPGQAKGSPEEIEHAFRETFSVLDSRINLLLALHPSQVDAMAEEQEERTRAA